MMVSRPLWAHTMEPELAKTGAVLVLVLVLVLALVFVLVVLVLVAELVLAVEGEDEERIAGSEEPTICRAAAESEARQWEGVDARRRVIALRNAPVSSGRGLCSSGTAGIIRRGKIAPTYAKVHSERNKRQQERERRDGINKVYRYPCG